MTLSIGIFVKTDLFIKDRQTHWIFLALDFSSQRQYYVLEKFPVWETCPVNDSDK